MIKSWQHKGLERFFLAGSKSGIIPAHAARLKIILQLLNAADNPKQLNLPGFGFHQLKGKLKNYYAVTVKTNWRVIFKFDGEDIILVDYLDYH